MIHRGYLRRGVSLEVIVEEDDNAEVSFDPPDLYDEESDSSPSSNSSAITDESRPPKEKRDRGKGGKGPGKGGGSGRSAARDSAPHGNSERIREKKKRRKQKEKEKEEEEEEEEERRRHLGRQRSLSCETLTILDVGDDEFSREQWEEEARDWDADAAENCLGAAHIHRSISRRKILASRSSSEDQQQQQQQGFEPENQETLVDDPADFEADHRLLALDDGVTVNGLDEAEDGRSWNPVKADRIQRDLRETVGNQEDLTDSDEIEPAENQQDLLPGNDTAADSSVLDATPPVDGNHGRTDGASTPTRQLASVDPTRPDNGSPVFLNQSPDLWLRDTFNDDENSWITVGELENTVIDPEVDPGLDESAAKDGAKTKLKEVRFSDELEFVNDENSEDISGAAAALGESIKAFDEQDTFSRRPSSPAQRSNSDQQASPGQHPSSHHNTALPVKVITSEPPQSTLEPCQTCENFEASSNAPHDHLVNVQAGRSLFERATKPPGKFTSLPHANPAKALENPDIIILERNSAPSAEDTVATRPLAEDRDARTHLTLTYNLHNAELHPEELPPPHTVSFVRRLFEGVSAGPLHDAHNYNFQSRFDHVRSNPSSKILRFDRDRRDTGGGGGGGFAPLPHAATEPSAHRSSWPEGRHTTADVVVGVGVFPPRRLGLSSHRAPEDYSSTGVHLRRPRLARGFDIRKALRENPRYFHIRVGHRDKEKDPKQRDQDGSNTKPSLARRNTITYSYVEANHQNQPGSTTTLRWTKETIDRSDAESLSSDSSEDSGVSRDFSSSILTAFASSSSKRSSTSASSARRGEYAADPSFKWIDPSVLNKIRSLGTTVIYFGPRHRPQQGRPCHPAGVLRTTFKDDVILRNDKATPTPHRSRGDALAKRNGGQESSSLQPSSAYSATASGAPTSNTYGKRTTPPRIVGVTTKPEPFDDRGGRDGSSPENTFFPPPDLPQLSKRQVKRVNSTGNNSIVYDFT